MFMFPTVQGTYLDTIQPIDYHRNGYKRRPEIGQRIRLSDGDIAQTNLLYKCYSEYARGYKRQLSRLFTRAFSLLWLLEELYVQCVQNLPENLDLRI